MMVNRSSVEKHIGERVGIEDSLLLFPRGPGVGRTTNSRMCFTWLRSCRQRPGDGESPISAEIEEALHQGGRRCGQTQARVSACVCSRLQSRTDRAEAKILEVEEGEAKGSAEQ